MDMDTTTGDIESSPIRRFPTAEITTSSQLSEMTRIALTQASLVDHDAPTTPRQPTRPVPPYAPLRRMRNVDMDVEEPLPPQLPVLSRTVKRYVPVRFNLETGDLEIVTMGIPEKDESGNPRTRESWIRTLKMCTPDDNRSIWDTYNLAKYVDDRGIFDELEFMADMHI
jgi:hypothetical protein